MLIPSPFEVSASAVLPHSSNHSQSRCRGSAALGISFDSRYDDEIVIKKTYQGGVAKKAGLRAGDTIVAIDDQEVFTPNELNRTLREYSAGDERELQYLRDGKNFLTYATLVEEKGSAHE